MRNRPSFHHRIRRPEVDQLLERHDWTHRAFARHLGLSASYWSAIYNGDRALSPAVRGFLRTVAVRDGLPGDALWERVAS